MNRHAGFRVASSPFRQPSTALPPRFNQDHHRDQGDLPARSVARRTASRRAGSWCGDQQVPAVRRFNSRALRGSRGARHRQRHGLTLPAGTAALRRRGAGSAERRRHAPGPLPAGAAALQSSMNARSSTDRDGGRGGRGRRHRQPALRREVDAPGLGVLDRFLRPAGAAVWRDASRASTQHQHVGRWLARLTPPNGQGGVPAVLFGVTDSSTVTSPGPRLTRRHRSR